MNKLLLALLMFMTLVFSQCVDKTIKVVKPVPAGDMEVVIKKMVYYKKKYNNEEIPEQKEQYKKLYVKYKKQYRDYKNRQQETKKS